MKEKISELLVNTLNYACCDNCGNNEDIDNCDGCHRKYQNWCLNKYVAEDIAENIIKIMNE